MTERRNPEALHEAAAGWRDMGKHLDSLVSGLDRQVGSAAAANWHGPAGEAFAADWHRLKRSVDDSLPAFELAAADLETAAAQPADHSGEGGTDHAAQPADTSSGGSQSSGMNMGYGFMALGQLAASMGGAFGKRGGGGGQGQRPTLTHQWETSGAPQGADPFGPPASDEAKTRGGEGIAKGVRSKPAAPEPRAAGGSAPNAAQDTKGAPAASSPRAAEPSGAGTPPADEAPSGRPGPDSNQHGAFG